MIVNQIKIWHREIMSPKHYEIEFILNESFILTDFFPHEKSSNATEVIDRIVKQEMPEKSFQSIS